MSKFRQLARKISYVLPQSPIAAMRTREINGRLVAGVGKTGGRGRFIRDMLHVARGKGGWLSKEVVKRGLGARGNARRATRTARELQRSSMKLGAIGGGVAVGGAGVGYAAGRRRRGKR